MNDSFDIMCQSIKWNRLQIEKYPDKDDFFRYRLISDLCNLNRMVKEYNEQPNIIKKEIKFCNGYVVGVESVG